MIGKIKTSTLRKSIDSVRSLDIFFRRCGFSARNCVLAVTNLTDDGHDRLHGIVYRVVTGVVLWIVSSCWTFVERPSDSRRMWFDGHTAKMAVPGKKIAGDREPAASQLNPFRGALGGQSPSQNQKFFEKVSKNFENIFETKKVIEKY